jgi:trehalose 6-phosphate phosphatase
MTTPLQDDLASRARVRRVAGALRRLFANRPAGLLTDVDGTISRITRHTNDATVSPTARRALARLIGNLDLVAVVTGRAVERAQRMVGVAGAAYVGNHGLEWLQDGAVVTDPDAAPTRPVLDEALAAVFAMVSPSDLVIEDKRVSLAIHYRLATDPPAVEDRLLDVLEPYIQAERLRMIRGGRVVNLLPALRIDKGEATRRLTEQHGLRAVAFFGDDVTDLDAFRMLRALRAEGSVQTLAVGVNSPEAPPAIRAETDLLLEGVDEVERVLTALAARSPAGVASGA